MPVGLSEEEVVAMPLYCSLSHAKLMTGSAQFLLPFFMTLVEATVSTIPSPERLRC